MPVLGLDLLVDHLQLAPGLVDAPLLEQVLNLRDPPLLGLTNLLLTGNGHRPTGCACTEG